MLKPVIAATAIFAIAGSSIVYAQQRWNGSEGDGGPRFEHRHHHLSVEDRAALTDARIAALKAGLELTADQAKSWPAFEQALRDMAQLRAQRRQAREAASQQPQTPGSPFDRLSQRADNMSKFSAALKRVADTGAPLYMKFSTTRRKIASRCCRTCCAGTITCMRQAMAAVSGATAAIGAAGTASAARAGRRGEQQFGGEGGGWREGQGFGNEGHRFGHDHGRIHELMGNDNGDDQELQL